MSVWYLAEQVHGLWFVFIINFYFWMMDRIRDIGPIGIHVPGIKFPTYGLGNKSFVRYISGDNMLQVISLGRIIQPPLCLFVIQYDRPSFLRMMDFSKQWCRRFCEYGKGNMTIASEFIDPGKFCDFTVPSLEMERNGKILAFLWFYPVGFIEPGNRYYATFCHCTFLVHLRSEKLFTLGIESRPVLYGFLIIISSILAPLPSWYKPPHYRCKESWVLLGLHEHHGMFGHFGPIVEKLFCKTIYVISDQVVIIKEFRKSGNGVHCLFQKGNLVFLCC